MLEPLPGPGSEFRSRVFDVLARWHGRITSEPFALSVGLRNRHALHDRLIENALPAFRELAGWVRALDTAVAVSQSGHSLTQVALDRGQYPGNESRAIAKLVGVDWERLRDAGAAEVVFGRMAQRLLHLRDLRAKRRIA